MAATNVVSARNNPTALFDNNVLWRDVVAQYLPDVAVAADLAFFHDCLLEPELSFFAGLGGMGRDELPLRQLFIMLSLLLSAWPNQRREKEVGRSQRSIVLRQRIP